MMANTPKRKIIVDMDDREPPCQLASDLENWNVIFDKIRLKVGDYQYKDLIIERKEINDFCASILDGRMVSQTIKMRDAIDNGKECFVIIIGRIKDRTSDIHENCVLGKIISLISKHNINVIMCDDEFQFYYCLRNLCDKHDIMIERRKDEKNN